MQMSAVFFFSEIVHCLRQVIFRVGQWTQGAGISFSNMYMKNICGSYHSTVENDRENEVLSVFLFFDFGLQGNRKFKRLTTLHINIRNSGNYLERIITPPA